MADKQCPKCSHWVSDEERLSGQCPFCKSFFESTIPVTSSAGSATGAPVIRTETPTQQSRRRNASSWPAWVAIPLVLVGLRACSAIVRQNDRPPPPQYHTPQFSIPEGEFTIEDFDVTTQELDRINELLRRLEEDGSLNPEDVPSDEMDQPETPSPEEPLPFDDIPRTYPNSTDDPLGGLLPSGSSVENSEDPPADTAENLNVETLTP